MDLSGKRILMIHGLASKPPESSLHELWCRCVIENIRMTHKSVAKALEQQPEIGPSSPPTIAFGIRNVPRIDKALEEIRPVLEADGGNIEIVAVKGDTVAVRLQGACASCPSATPQRWPTSRPPTISSIIDAW